MLNDFENFARLLKKEITDLNHPNTPLEKLNTTYLWLESTTTKLPSQKDIEDNKKIFMEIVNQFLNDNQDISEIFKSNLMDKVLKFLTEKNE